MFCKLVTDFRIVTLEPDKFEEQSNYGFPPELKAFFNFNVMRLLFWC